MPAIERKSEQLCRVGYGRPRGEAPRASWVSESWRHPPDRSSRGCPSLSTRSLGRKRRAVAVRSRGSVAVSFWPRSLSRSFGPSQATPSSQQGHVTIRMCCFRKGRRPPWYPADTHPEPPSASPRPRLDCLAACNAICNAICTRKISSAPDSRD